MSAGGADAEALARLAEVGDLGRVDADQPHVHGLVRIEAHDDGVAVDHIRHAPGQRFIGPQAKDQRQRASGEQGEQDEGDHDLHMPRLGSGPVPRLCAE